MVHGLVIILCHPSHIRIYKDGDTMVHGLVIIYSRLSFY